MEIDRHLHPTVEKQTQTQNQQRLDPKIVKKLSVLKPWLSVSHIALEYIFIIGAVVLCTMFWHPLLYLVCIMWIGARQHAIAIMIHDASHYRILKNRKTNDFVSELFLAFPLFVTMRGYRLSHLAHHRHMNTEYDPDWVSKETPDWVFPKSRWELFIMLAKITLGANLFWMIRLIVKGGRPDAAENKKIASRAFTLSRIAYYVVLLGTLTYFGWWLHYLLYWIVPMMTWLQLILRLRSIAEHFGIEYDDREYTGARTTYPNLFDRTFLVSKNVWFHLDHHLYPSVPFFNLPQLHEELNKIPAFKEQAHITHGYLGVLKECSSNLKTLETEKAH